MYNIHTLLPHLDFPLVYNWIILETACFLGLPEWALAFNLTHRNLATLILFTSHLTIQKTKGNVTSCFSQRGGEKTVHGDRYMTFSYILLTKRKSLCWTHIQGERLYKSMTTRQWQTWHMGLRVKNCAIL